MSSDGRRRAVVWTCIAAMLAVVANSAWQWRRSAGLGWSGLYLQIASEFSDGGRQQRTRIKVEEVEPRSPGAAAGLRRGDHIVELNGSRERLGERFRALKFNESAEVLTDRTPDSESLLRLVSPWSRPAVIGVLLLNGSLGLISLLIGTFVYRKRPDDPRTYILFVLTSLYAIVRFTEIGPVHRYGVDPSANLVQVLAHAWAGLLFFPALAHFFFVFPRERPEVRDQPRRVAALYRPAVAAAGALTGFVLLAVWLYPPESPRLTDAAATLVAAWPSISRFESFALLAGAVLALTGGACGARATGAEYRACGWKGLLLHAPASWVIAIASTLLLISTGLRATAIVRSSAGLNHFALVSLAAAAVVFVGGILFTLAVVYPVAACVALWRNYREADNVGKRQLRWPLFGLGVAVAGYLATGVTLRIAAQAWNLVPDSLASVMVFHLRHHLPDVALLLIPLSIAFAVLKYRLMDIDVYIRKTIVYGAATGLLSCLFLLIVGGAGRWLSGGEWLPVAATLTVGVLFIPVRSKVQDVVDRKFYRRRDYAAALSRLAARPDPQAAVDIVQEAIPVKSAALWLASREAPVYELRAATAGMAERDIGTLPLADGAARLRAGGDRIVGVRSDGRLTGYLAVGAKLADTEWDEKDRNFLEAAATQIGLALDADDGEGEQACAIQRALLPASLPQPPGLRLSGMWHPAKAVGGDYYDVLRIGEMRLGLAVADVAGKGVAAALLMSNVQAALKLLAPEITGPAALCARLNALVCSNVAPGRFVTFFYGVLDLRERTLTYCNAGHNPPILCGPGGESTRLETGGLPLGVFPAVEYREGIQKVPAGGSLLLYTDGVIDATDHNGEEFGEQRLIELVQANRGADAEWLQWRIEVEVTRHCAGVFSDDVTVLAVTVGPAALAVSA